MRTACLFSVLFLISALSHAQTRSPHDKPESNAECVKQGQAALARQDYNTALAWFTEALRRNPRDVDAYLLRARVYRDGKGYIREAMADLSRAIQLDPSRMDAHLTRARLLGVHGDGTTKPPPL